MKDIKKSSKKLKIVLWGATGLTGREILSQALDDGHELKVIIRNPDMFKVEHTNLTVVQGDVLNAQLVEEAVAGGDVVISAIGTGASFSQVLIFRTKSHFYSLEVYQQK